MDCEGICSIKRSVFNLTAIQLYSVLILHRHFDSLLNLRQRFYFYFNWFCLFALLKGPLKFFSGTDCDPLHGLNPQPRYFRFYHLFKSHLWCLSLWSLRNQFARNFWKLWSLWNWKCRSLKIIIINPKKDKSRIAAVRTTIPL